MPVRRSQFDYHSYRGRTTLTDWLKRIALILLILVILLVGALYVGQRFLVYTDDGLQIQLPSFFQQEDASSSSIGGVNVIEGDPSAQTDSSQPEEPAPLVENPACALLSVPLSSLVDGSAAQLAQSAGADGVVVELKTDLGALGWQSQQALASMLQEGVDPQSQNSALTAWNQGTVYTAARLSCFRDEALGSQMAYTLRTTSDLRWMDYERLHWTSPSNPDVRTYLVALMVELAQLGFDEIVLEHWGYPTASDGFLDNLLRSSENYPEDALDVAVTEFLSQAAQALEPYGVKLSLAGPVEAVSGADPSSGLTVAALNANVDRLWIPGTRSEVLAALEGAGVAEAEERLVSLTDQLDAAQTGGQAVWPDLLPNSPAN